MQFLNCFARIFIYLLLLFFFTTQSACKKYLDVKRKQNLAIPSTVKDLQALLDNQVGNLYSPFYAEYLADNHYLTTASWNTLTTDYRFSYTWQRDAVVYLPNWSMPYTGVYNANFILDNLSEITITNAADQVASNHIKGAALFFRGFMFHQLAQLFCKPFSSSASADPGIVLRLTSAVGAPASKRATVQETYKRIIEDIKQSAELLPEVPRIKTLPSSQSANGLLSRVYLSMGDYENAMVYANKAITQSTELLDYNTILTGRFPGFASNPELLWMSYNFYFLLDPPYLNVDSSLYQSYESNDLRKSLFYSASNNIVSWIGSYVPDNKPACMYNGIAMDELYLNRAECYAKAGKKEEAMKDLNQLLLHRYKTGSFQDLVATDAADALRLVRQERRKELAFRGIRWTDLRRYNQEGAGITLKRVVDNATYTLPPNDLRWTLLIPQEEIQQSGIEQNPR